MSTAPSLRNASLSYSTWEPVDLQCPALVLEELGGGRLQPLVFCDGSSNIHSRLLLCLAFVLGVGFCLAVLECISGA